MITHTNIISYISNTLENYIAEDIFKQAEFFNENYENTKAPLRFIYKFQSGDTEFDITNLRCNLYIEVRQDLLNEIMDSLTDYATDYNESIVSLNQLEAVNNVMDEVTYRIKNIISTPSIINDNQQLGFERFTTLSMDFRLIVFVDALATNDAFIKIDNQKVTNILQYNYSTTRQKDSFVLGALNLQALNYSNSLQKTLTISYIVSKTDDTHEAIMLAADSENDDIFNIVFYNGKVTRTFIASILDYHEVLLTSDVTKATVTFVAG